MESQPIASGPFTLTVGVIVTWVVTTLSHPETAEVNEGHTCLKGRFAFQFYNHPDRLREPMIKKNGKFTN